MNNSTSHIAGMDQPLGTFLEVQMTRIVAFAKWVRETADDPDTVLDESDWDDCYNEWFHKVETGVGFGPFGFENFMEEN